MNPASMLIGFGFAVRGALIPGVVIDVGAASSPGFSAVCSYADAVTPRVMNAQLAAPVMRIFFNLFILSLSKYRTRPTGRRAKPGFQPSMGRRQSSEKQAAYLR